jgi:hypothetical protein
MTLQRPTDTLDIHALPTEGTQWHEDVDMGRGADDLRRSAAQVKSVIIDDRT